MNTSITREEALSIAAKELRNSFYSEQLENDWEYGLINFGLECEDSIYDGKPVYLIYVVGGTFCAHRPKGYIHNGNSIISKMKQIFGEFDKDSNIKCVIFKENGDYKYLK